MVEGPEAGLALVDKVGVSGKLDSYYLLPAVRGDLLARLGRCEEAAADFERASRLTLNTTERRFLLDRAAAQARSRSARR
jgi:predicted RNA polymerase sigma factor